MKKINLLNLNLHDLKFICLHDFNLFYLRISLIKFLINLKIKYINRLVRSVLGEDFPRL